MSFGVNASFTEDWHEKASSALDLSFGYVQAPEGIYFSSELTINIWMMLRSFLVCMRIIDLVNDAFSDNVIFAFSCRNIASIMLYIVKNTEETQSILLNTWCFLTTVVNGSNAEVYYNGTFMISGYDFCSIVRNITRTKNYVGKKHWEANPNINVKIDDLKIYNRALNKTEILEEIRANWTKPKQIISINLKKLKYLQ